MVVHDSRKWMDLLWKDFFKDPSPWFFNLSSKLQYNSVSPDFRHKTKNQCLWIDDGRNNPSWIHEKRAFLLSLQEENQVRNKNRKKEFDLVALLKDCTKKKDLYGGIKIYTYTHEIVLLRKSPHIASCLIHMFTKCGDFVMAKEVLANFSFSNVVPWNTLISGYVHNGQAQEALECYERMQNKGVSSNAVTFTCILKACGGIGAINKGKQIHYRVLSERLLEKDVVVGSALVDLYVKCGVLAKAQEVLEELPIRNVVSWSSLIAGYVLGGQGQEALNCLEKMQFEGLLPDATTFTCVLQACGNMGNAYKGKQIHEQIVSRQLLEKDIMLGNALVDMYAKCGMLPTAENVLEELRVRNVISWNALISGYVQQGQGHEALNCFERLQSENLSPNAVTFICILKACGLECAVKKGLYIHDLIVGKRLLNNDILLNNALLDMYTKFGLLAKAKVLFEELPIRDIVSWNALIAGCVQQGFNKEALSWFERLQNDVLSPNIITFICLLNACGNTRSTEKGKQLHSMIMSMDLLEKDIVLGNALVDMYCKCGLLENAQKVFHDLPNPNIVTWNALISGYARMEQGHEGLTCFKEMQREGLNPSLVTFICILKSCISVGAIGKGEQIHEMIKSWSLRERDIILSNALVNMYAKCGLLPKAQNVLEELNIRDVVSWNTLIVGYAQQGQGQEALNCFGLMQHEGISPNKVTFTCILKSCGHSGLLEEAQLLFEHVKRGIGVSLELQHYTHMVVVYSSLGHFDKAMSVMKMMPLCDYSAVWFALVDSCRKWGNMKLGSWAFEHSLQVNIDCMQPYVLTT